MMDALDRLYPAYGFARHKGYGTKEHLDAIARCGPCPEHRMTFAPLAVRPETGALF
jgi:ribonuclease HII